MTYCGVLLVWCDTDASILANRSTGFILKAVLQLAKRLGMVSYLFARQCGGVTSFLHLLLSLFLLTQWGLTTHIWTGSSVVQIMAHHLFGAKPLPQPVLTYSQWEPCEQISKEYESVQNALMFFKEMQLKMSSAKCQTFCSVLNGWRKPTMHVL